MLQGVELTTYEKEILSEPPFESDDGKNVRRST